MNWKMIGSRSVVGQQPKPLTAADLDAHFKQNAQLLAPQAAPIANPMQSIQARYTQAPMVDNSLAPLAMYQAFRQTGQLPTQNIPLSRILSGFGDAMGLSNPNRVGGSGYPSIATSTKGVK